MGDRALRQRKAPVNYVASTFQTPEKEREQKRQTGRLKRKLVSSDEAAGDKENTLLSNDPPAAAVEEPRPEVQQYKKRGKPAKKQLIDAPAGAPHTLDQQPQAGSQEEGKVQKGKKGKKAGDGADAAPPADATPSDGAASEGQGRKESQETDGVAEKGVGKLGAAKGGGKNIKGAAFDKKKVSQQVAAAAAAVAKAQGKKASSGSTRAAKTGGSKGGRGESPAGADVSEEGGMQGVLEAVEASGRVRKGATTRGASQKQKPVADDRVPAKEKKVVVGDTGGGSGESQPRKVTSGERKRKAQERAVVEIDGGDEGDALPPPAKAAEPSAVLAPLINASKAAAERQRETQGRGLAVSKETGAFLKLQEAYSKLQTKYEALKQLRLDETENLFDAQKKVVKDHGEAATKLVSHWKEQVARLQQERTAVVETTKRARELTQENALLKVKFIEQEEKHLLIEVRLQELQAELQNATQRALEYARPGPDSRSADIRAPAEDVGAKGAADIDVQVEAPTEPAKPNSPPVETTGANRELPRGFVEVRKEDPFPGQIAAGQGSESPALDREQLKREGFEEGLKQGLKEGLKEGQKQGFEEGLKEGRKQGFEEGLKEGLKMGLEEGLKQGEGKGFEQGLEEGMKQAMQKSFEQGWAKGLEEGLERGLAKGLKEGLEKGSKQGLEEGFEKSPEGDVKEEENSKEDEGEGFEKGLEEGLEKGLEDADPMAGLGGDPDADSAWRELLQILTGCCADECGENKIRFTHERSGLVFYLTGTPQDDDVTGDVGREVDMLSRASSFFDADAAGNVSFLYEPEEFGLLDDDISEDNELRRPKTLTMRQVPGLVHDILGQTIPLS